MATHLLEVDRCTAQQMAEGKLDVAIPRAAFKEAAAIQVALGDATNQFTDADF
jgi:hypothetical protein